MTHNPTKSWRALAAAVVLAGCAAHVNVPPTYQGAVAVQLVNQADQNVCKFAMAPVGQPMGDSWMGRVKLRPDHSADFKLKPGRYTIRTSSCDGGWTAEDTTVEISGPMVIVTGSRRLTTVPAGFSQTLVSVIPAAAPEMPASGGSEGGGAEPAQCLPDGAHPHFHDECCSKATETSEHGDGDVCCTPPGRHNGCSS